VSICEHKKNHQKKIKKTQKKSTKKNQKNKSIKKTKKNTKKNPQKKITRNIFLGIVFCIFFVPFEVLNLINVDDSCEIMDCSCETWQAAGHSRDMFCIFWFPTSASFAAKDPGEGAMLQATLLNETAISCIFKILGDGDQLVLTCSLYDHYLFCFLLKPLAKT
jgi:hypothetical protein